MSGPVLVAEDLHTFYGKSHILHGVGLEVHEGEIVTLLGRNGAGMGAALNTASAMGAYTLSDRGTWLSFGNKGELAVLIEGDPRLLNRYDVILLNPQKHPEVKQEPARRLADWLTSFEGQAAIAEYQINGEQLFHPSARTPK